MPAPVDITDPFRSLSDPTRRQILDVLAAGALPVGVLASHFPAISRPAVSKHLRILREGGLVREERAGRERYYSLNHETIAETRDWIRSVHARGVRTGRAGGPVKPAQPSQPAKPAQKAQPSRAAPSRAKARRPDPHRLETRPEESAPDSDTASNSDDWQTW